MGETTIINTEKFFTEIDLNNNLRENRKKTLLNIVNVIIHELKSSNQVNLNFICTHNSRRSQFAQVWAHYAIEYFNLDGITSYSGGTEVTAMHRNTVKSLRDVQFKFDLVTFSHENPVYEVTYENNKNPIVSYSKLYDDEFNKKPFIAITTCDSADKNCPFIPDALKKIHLAYIDPKASDDTPEMSSSYLNTSKEIASEMYFIFKEVKSQL
jgi:arsenate reductase